MKLQEWLSRYQQGGMDSLLATEVPSGRRRPIPARAEAALAKRLQQMQGFESCDGLLAKQDGAEGFTSDLY